MRHFKHFICSINQLTGVRTITDDKGNVIESVKPTTIYSAHVEAWVALQRIYEEANEQLD